MSAVKRLFLNIVVCIGIVCNFFGVFSQAWITDYGGSIGIVPFYSVCFWSQNLSFRFGKWFSNKMQILAAFKKNRNLAQLYHHGTQFSAYPEA